MEKGTGSGCERDEGKNNREGKKKVRVRYVESEIEKGRVSRKEMIDTINNPYDKGIFVAHVVEVEYNEAVEINKGGNVSIYII